MKIIVCGDRFWSEREYLFEWMDAVSVLFEPITTVIEGCAPGADRTAGWPCPVALREDEPDPLPGWATERGITVDHNPAQWHILGKRAGPLRNETMLAKGPDMVVAFHRDLAASRGTGHMVRIARSKNVPVIVFPDAEGSIAREINGDFA